MPREAEVRHEWPYRGISRTYRVWLLDDPPERAAAVAFFNGLPDGPWLTSKIALPKHLDALSIEDANAWLRDNPLPELYDGLVCWDGDAIRDDDLRWLEYIPELEVVRLHSDHITDAGVSHFRHSRQVEWFELYSSRVTDECLDVVRQFRKLRLLDLQGSPGLSRRACETLVRELGVQQSWLPCCRAEPTAAPDPAT